MLRTERCLGIVLFQLGGPDTLEAIQPFLYNLFCDPDIIDFPFARIGRKPSCQADFRNSSQESAAPLLRDRRRLAYPALHRAAGPGA